MHAAVTPKASSSALRILRRDFTRVSSCRRLVTVVAGAGPVAGKSSSSPCRKASISLSRPSTLQHIISYTRTPRQHLRRSYTTTATGAAPSSPDTSPTQHEYEPEPESEINPITFADPHRPDLFYHYTPAPTPLSRVLPAFALSYLDALPPASAAGGEGSEAVIGWLPAQTIVEGEVEGEAIQGEGQGSTLDDFMGNDKFLSFLHATIQTALEQGQDDIWRDAAIAHGNGWMHIGDQRNIPALGRVGDPDDILASVLVQDGKIVPGTYQAMPSYRICTVDGVLQLTPGLAGCLKEALAQSWAAAAAADADQA
ncbi:hypothetical protein JR316_0008979 [Psilocybe cubensis]|uniref:Uncharacterized protein n=2 Tax=Psilocybe cubensis TaxID=181762 RepID=A0ACB8GSG3_PSICU|nr:hypothetical protein JR316_0008979 [Psilocybe cubensis]KAH9478524.1 hypothetical protein JR316_0008979 [Psilocybe cubensis]